LNLLNETDHSNLPLIQHMLVISSIHQLTLLLKFFQHLEDQ